MSVTSINEAVDVLKACLIRSNKFNPKKHFKHGLIELARDVEISFTPDQESTLRIFTDSAVWFGRYPNPQFESELHQNEANWNSLLKVEKFGSITVTGSNERKWPTFNNYVDLWQKSEQQYWEIEPKDPREF